MPRSQDVPDSPYLFEGMSDLSGGAVDYGANHLLSPNQAEYLLNWEVDFQGRRQKRKGTAWKGTPGGVLAANAAQGLAEFEDPTGDYERIVGLFGNHLWSTDGDLSWTQHSAVSLYNIPHQFMQGRAEVTGAVALYAAGCVPLAANASLPYDHLCCFDKGGGATLITTVRPRSILWHQSRLWAFNSCATLHGPDTLAWSNILDGRNWDNGETLRVGSDASDPGTCILPGRGDYSRLLLFKERSAFMLDLAWETDGFIPATANALDYTKSLLRPIVFGTGCVASRAALWVPGQQGADVLFLSREGVRSLNRSATDAQAGAGLPLSTPIQEQIDRISWEYADRSLATYWDGYAYFAVPVDGGVNPTFIMAYNTQRPGWTFYDWNIGGWAKAKLGTNRKLFFISSTTGSDGTAATAATGGHHLYECFNGYVDPKFSAIDADEHSRGLTFDENAGSGLRHLKKWRQLILKIQSADTNCTLSVSYRIDEEDTWTDLTTIGVSPEDSYPYLPVQLPFTFDSGRIVKRSVSLKGARPGYKIQFRFRDNTSFGPMRILEAEALAHRMAVNLKTP